ncbi:hypothetical protein [Kribbella sp. DT2]|uniref:hypothetical protein n=1 Tax=Kribbella sp. DT2 TaxID=3393427 RepID=UPI003CF9B96C
MILMRAIGVLTIGIGLLLIRVLDGGTTHAIGLGFWCFGVLTLLDALMMRDGLPAQILWGLGVGFSVWMIGYTDVPDRAGSGTVATVMSAITVALAVALFLRKPPGI